MRKRNKKHSEYIEKRTAWMKDPVKRAAWLIKMSEATKKQMANVTPDQRVAINKKISESRKGIPAWNKGKKFPQWSGENHWAYGKSRSPEAIEKHRQAILGTKQSAEWIAKRVAGRAGYQHSEETRKRIREASLAAWSKPEVRAKVSGENSSCWKGGANDYWIEGLKGEIRTRDGLFCQVCGSCQADNGRLLDVHHIDYDRTNNQANNLISLCMSCHRKTNYNREAWRILLSRLFANIHPQQLS